MNNTVRVKNSVWPDIDRKNDELSMLVIFIVLLAIVIALSIWFTKKIDDINKRIDQLENTEIIVEHFEIEEIPGTPLIEDNPIPQDVSAFKTYMDWRKITRKDSQQYYLQQQAHTDGSGLRMLGDRFMIALGTGYAKFIGQKFDIYFDDGSFIRCIVGDYKDNEHTDPSNRFVVENGNLIEFIVDTRVLPDHVVIGGDISALGIPGKVLRIVEVEE